MDLRRLTRAFIRFRTATVSAAPEIPAALAKRAYLARQLWLLTAMTSGSKMALSLPWGK